MAERWRLFVAIPIGRGLRERLAAEADGWRARPDLAGLRWSDPAGWHVTLHFLGATDPREVPAIRGRLGAVGAAHVPFRCPTGGLGGFPSAARARVAWYGVADPEHRLRALARGVAAALAPGPDHAPFRAHVTLARARSRTEAVDLRPWIPTAAPPEGMLDVDAIHLVRSRPGGGPAHYESLLDVAIGERVGV